MAVNSFAARHFNARVFLPIWGQETDVLTDGIPRIVYIFAESYKIILDSQINQININAESNQIKIDGSLQIEIAAEQTRIIYD